MEPQRDLHPLDSGSVGFELRERQIGCWGWIRTNISALNRRALDWLSYPAMADVTGLAPAFSSVTGWRLVSFGFTSMKWWSRR